MAEVDASELIELVRDVKVAVTRAQQHRSWEHVRLQSVELQVKALFSRQTGAEVPVKLVPVELGAQYERGEEQLISLTLTPQPEDLVLYGEVADQLAGAIDAIVAAVEAAAETEPRFALDGAAIELTFARTRERKASLVIKGGTAAGSSHTVRLVIAPH